MAIVVATVNDPDMLRNSLYPDDPAPSIKIAKVLKGAIRANGIVSICPGMGHIDLPTGKKPTVLVFLEGKDGNAWIPLWGSIGIVPQNKDGRFVPRGLSEVPKSVSVDELQKIIKWYT